MNILGLARFLNGFLMVALPIGLGIFLVRRYRLGWRLWWIGAATFVLSQTGHLPFNWILNRLFTLEMLPSPPASWRVIFFAMLGGLSAGLWEELARAGIYRWWADDARSWRKGMLLGAGHGGIEAIILGVLVLVSFVNMLILSGPYAARLVPPDQMALVQQQVASYWSGNWQTSLIGAVERVFAMTNHLALSLLVLQAFTRKQPAWIAAAVLYHTLMDGSMVYFAALWGKQPWGMLAIEGMIGVTALISLGIIFALRQPEPAPEPDEVEILPPGEPAPTARIVDLLKQQPEVEINEDTLDKSRYSG
jgi:uncharacterized membrane protein YhfC